MLLITFTVGLIFVALQFNALWGIFLNVLGIFNPLFIGLAIAFILSRPCAFFRRHLENTLGKTKLKKLCIPIAVLLSYLIFVVIVATVVSIVIPQLVMSIQTFASNLSSYVSQAQVWINAIVEQFHLETFDLTKLDAVLKNLLSGTLSALSNTVPQLVSLTSGIFSVAITACLAFVFSAYMLAGKDALLGQCRNVLRAYLPQKLYGGILDVTKLTAETFSHFVVGQLTEACILGFLCFVGMIIFRFDYPLLVAVLIGTTALVPIVGTYFGAGISAILLAIISPVQAFWFLVFLICLQQFEGNLIYPRVVGTSLGLPAIWVLGAITVGGGLFGFLGMLLSVPVASVLYTLLKKDVRSRLKEID